MKYRLKRIWGLWQLIKLKRFIRSNESPEILFIISAGRSGSTLLRKMLMERYSIHIPPESTSIIPGFLSKLKEVRSLNDIFFKHAESVASDSDFKFWNLPFEKVKNVLQKSQSKERKLDRIIWDIYSLHRDTYNPSATLVGDKTPYLVFFIKEIKMIFPKAKFIYLVRDPKSVISSRMDKFNENLVDSTNRWLWASAEMRKSITKKDAFIKYESLVGKTDETLNFIKEKLNLPLRESELLVTEEMLGDVILRHHKRTQGNLLLNRNIELAQKLDSKSIDYIENVTNKLCKYYGY